MSTATEARKTLKGGEWLIKESSPADTFTPEAFYRRTTNDPGYV